MKALLLTTLLLGTFIAPSECAGHVKINVVRQERYNGYGSDFIGADMRVVDRLANNTDHAIYVYGFAFEQDFMPMATSYRSTSKPAAGTIRPEITNRFHGQKRVAK